MSSESFHAVFPAIFPLPFTAFAWQAILLCASRITLAADSRVEE